MAENGWLTSYSLARPILTQNAIQRWFSLRWFLSKPPTVLAEWGIRNMGRSDGLNFMRCLLNELDRKGMVMMNEALALVLFDSDRLFRGLNRFD